MFPERGFQPSQCSHPLIQSSPANNGFHNSPTAHKTSHERPSHAVSVLRILGSAAFLLPLRSGNFETPDNQNDICPHENGPLLAHPHCTYRTHAASLPARGTGQPKKHSPDRGR